MIEVIPLKYGVAFKKAFGKKEIFTSFVKDVIGVKIKIDEVHQEYEYKERIGKVAIKYDLFAEDKDNRIIIEVQQLKEGDFFDRFMYYHIISMAEQVSNYIDYRFTRNVYTIVVLTSVPRDKSIKFSMGIADMDVKDEEGKKQDIYKHKLIFLEPRLVNKKTPEPVKKWLELIKDSLDGTLDEEWSKIKEFKKIVEEIKVDKISPEELARIKDEAAWEKVKKSEFEKGKEEGIQEGIQKGIQEGIQKGIQKGQLKGIKLGLKLKFGKKGLKLMQEIEELQSIEKLDKVEELLEEAKTLDEFKKGIKQI